MHGRFESSAMQSVGRKNLDSWRKLFVQHMREIDQQFDPGHRLDHVLRVTKTSLELAEKENANLAVVLPSAILHDSLPMDKFSKKRKDASKISAQNTIELLKQWGYPDEFHDATYHAILCHSYSAGFVPQSLEAKIVQDADRLDALGAIGIARTMAVGFNHGNSLYDLAYPFPDKREANDQRFILDHFYMKLFKLPQTFHTRSAKEEARSRIQIMEQYLHSLAREIGTEYLPFQQY
ncbi:HD domain-containing protein [Legionella maioricensis]|uniref:HD domain-containing protein n=1 Tax=Legionella maioricensis TaxID=2896528 RepID=A0A9X2I8S0_9GAMM|nr:HD domain-containing protein [Legionella maioricensis]MCL9682595.1 HD domain-containing protein [Legionella maioricensis]MCL9686158.1 HD domain-containing protein [Legionella maioricensis]